jgi:hypothetical protein
VLLAIHFALRGTYWEYTEGVYATTARLFLHGHGLYTDVVVAQPPGVILFGAGALWLHDGLEWLRLCVGALQLIAGLAAGQIVWRLTRSRLGAVLTPELVLLTPWALHEHGALLPETVGLPLLLLGPLIASPIWLGLLCGALPLVKVTFVLPALALILTARRPRQTAGVAVLVLATGLLAVTVGAGSAFWRDVVQAQAQTGYHRAGVMPGLWSQAVWNLFGLLVPAGLAVWQRRQAADQPLLRAVMAMALAMLVTILSTLKTGTSLDVLVPIEAVLVPLAVCGATWAKSHVRTRAIATAGVVFVLVQSISLLSSPSHPRLFVRPFSGAAWQVVLTRDQLSAAVAKARACPGEPFAGPPLVAFAAGRPMAGDQPDQFLISHAPVLRRAEQRAMSSAAAAPASCRG